jgi:hypothetical protein
MAKSRRSYIITHHARERFFQRSNKQFAHLQYCCKTFCDICDSLKKKIDLELVYDCKQIDEEMYRRLDDADEDRSCINNTNFMEWYYKKYGYDRRFEFLIHNDIIFVVIMDGDKKIIVTCLISQMHFIGKGHLSKTRFNKLNKKVSAP